MTRTSIQLVLWITLLYSVSVNAENLDVISCPHHEEFSVSFTSWDNQDLFSIDLLGDDCSNSVRVITVRNSSGRVIYTNSVRLQQLSAQPLRYDDVLVRTVEAIRKSISGASTKDIPAYNSPDVDPENYYQGGEENRENYEKARSLDKPVMCVRIGYEYWECFWYDPDLRATNYLYGFGA